MKKRINNEEFEEALLAGARTFFTIETVLFYDTLYYVLFFNLKSPHKPKMIKRSTDFKKIVAELNKYQGIELV